MTGRIICTGLGPGAQDLMSVRSDLAIRNAQHIAYFRKIGRKGQARQIVEGMLRPDVTEHAMEYPVTTEIPISDPAYNQALASFYDAWATRLAALAATEDVVVLCEGDPFFYGSFMHLYTRLQGRVPLDIVPGITGMSGCWTATGTPITWGDDVLTVLMATLPEAELESRARGADALVFMKIGRNFPKVVKVLESIGRHKDAWLVERGTMPGERVLPLSEVTGEVPYFAIVLVHGQGRRP